jgi:hypothetical protein
MDTKFYEDEFMPTMIEEIDYIRSPLYDLAKAQFMGDEEAHELLDEIGLKLSMIETVSPMASSP